MSSKGRFIAIILLLGLVAEISAWLLDAKYGFRRDLLDTLNTVEPISEPIPAKTALPWEDRVIYIRSPERGKKPSATFILGGRSIPDADYGADAELLKPETLAKDKRKRIFIVGCSAAFGYGSHFKSSFGYLLGELLGYEEFRVFNASRLGWTSGQLVPLVKRIVDLYDPYAIILYTGNNEWVHWVPAGQSWVSKELLRKYRFLSQSRLFAGILFLRLKGLVARKEESRRSDIRFEIHQDIDGFDYALAHPADDFSTQDTEQWLGVKKKFLNVFEDNLSNMINYGKKHNVRIMLLTVPFSYKLSVAWKHPQPESMVSKNRDEVRRYLRDVIRLIRAKEFFVALAKLDKALTLDPLVPILNYLKAFCLEQLGEMAEAEQAYEFARENMIGNLGSRLSINRSITSIAAEEGVAIIDLKEIFDNFQHSRGGYFNEQLILDDCHPSPQGHKLIAQVLAQALKSK